MLGEVHDNPRPSPQPGAGGRGAGARGAGLRDADAGSGAARDARRCAATREALGEALGWDDSGWPDFAHLLPDLHRRAARRRSSAAPCRATTCARADDEGAAAVFGDAAPLFGLDRAAARRRAGGARGGADGRRIATPCPSEMLPGMVEAQRLRDAALARAVAGGAGGDRRRRWRSSPATAMRGTDWGVPRRSGQARPGLARAVGRPVRGGAGGRARPTTSGW